MTTAPEHILPPGTRFGRYEIVRLLGSGAMGCVYEALHLGLRKRVALKTLHPSMAANREVRARFLREGEASARIRHPHAVELFDVGAHEGVYFLVMEFLEGGSLRAELERRGKLPVSEAIELLLPVLSALECAHRNGVIHRDLKPDNIMLMHDAMGELVPKVVDFGISKLADTQDATALTHANTVLGTPLYMSPEQARGGGNRLTF